MLADQGPPGLRGRLPELIGRLEGEVLGQTQGALLWLGIVLVFWSVSMGALLLTKALNAVFEVEETRPAWKRIAYSLTLAPRLALAVITAVGFMLVTSRAMVWLSWWVGLDEAFVFLWSLLGLPVAFLLLSLVVSIVYRFALNAAASFRSVVPGGSPSYNVVRQASLAFAFVLALFFAIRRGLWEPRCGHLTTPLLYLLAAAVLLGAEVNAVTRREPLKRVKPTLST